MHVRVYRPTTGATSGAGLVWMHGVDSSWGTSTMLLTWEMWPGDHRSVLDIGRSVFTVDVSGIPARRWHEPDLPSQRMLRASIASWSTTMPRREPAVLLRRHRRPRLLRAIRVATYRQTPEGYRRWAPKPVPPKGTMNRGLRLERCQHGLYGSPRIDDWRRSNRDDVRRCIVRPLRHDETARPWEQARAAPSAE